MFTKEEIETIFCCCLACSSKEQPMIRLFVFIAVLCSVVGSLRIVHAESPAVVYLFGGRDSKFPDGTGTYQGLLGRELVRRASLCAARDELSYLTLDSHLGQKMPRLLSM